MPDKVGYEKELKEKGGVRKKILEVGEGKDKPESPALVTVTYKGYFTKSEEVFDSGENVDISLNDKSLPKGFKISLESMRKNEKSIFTIKSKFAFKDPGPNEIGRAHV